MPPRLDATTLASADAALPGYDRRAIAPGIVHLGLGAFARAHLAVYVDDLLAAGHTELGIVGVSLRSPDVPDALRPQHGLYTLVTVDGESRSYRVIGSVLDVLHAPTQVTKLRAALATTPIVTITVTEKGYPIDRTTGGLDRAHPDVQHDLAHPDEPRGLVGHLVAMARTRRAIESGPVTVASLDNVSDNGATLRRLTLDLATATGEPGLADWIGANVAFPSSMVDRMTPATDSDLRTTTAAAIGLTDAWPVRAEPFSQWVIERGWATPMPALADVGVQVVDAVAPWEALKLRVLNALHTAAALYGLRHGHATVDAVVADPGGRGLLERLAVEIAEVLTAPAGTYVDAYVATTLERFGNSGLGHRCDQIATDSSQKLPVRIVPTLRERLARDLPVDALVDVLALWAWSTRGRAVKDPLTDRFAAAGDDPLALATALVGLPEVFGDLAGNPHLVAAVGHRLADVPGGTTENVR